MEQHYNHETFLYFQSLYILTSVISTQLYWTKLALVYPWHWSVLGALVKSPIEVCAYVNIFPTGFDVVASEIDVIAGVCIHAMQFCLSSIQRIHCTASTGHIRLPTFWQCCTCDLANHRHWATWPCWPRLVSYVKMLAFVSLSPNWHGY